VPPMVRGDQLFCCGQSGGTAFGGTIYSMTIQKEGARRRFNLIIWCSERGIREDLIGASRCEHHTSMTAFMEVVCM